MKANLIIKGIVVKGKQRGKELGFPTANIPLAQSINDEGIYISQTEIDGAHFPSLTFIGSAKTFNETDAKAETYILDFDQDLYGKEITVELLTKIRDNQKFNSVEELQKAMRKDLDATKKHFQKKTK